VAPTPPLPPTTPRHVPPRSPAMRRSQAIGKPPRGRASPPVYSARDVDNSYPRRVSDPAEPGNAAAFFDLDKTVIAKSSTLAFGRSFFQGGLLNRRAVLRSAYAQFVFALAGADEDQMDRMREYLTSMCTGWDVQQIRDIVEETLHDVIDPLVYTEAVELIASHRQAGRAVVIVSASGSEVVEPIARLLGADEAIATTMVEEDGRYTGQIAEYVYGPVKAAAVRRVAAERGYDLAECYAYSDSVTDLPMLDEVGHPVVVNPDRALRKEAVHRGWPVLSFSNAVPLRERITPAAAGSVTLGAAGLAAAGAAWYLHHRRRAGAG
jgi:HAD superfamily hydrolase (TIGR01490 family)